MKDWDTMTISKVGQGTLPKWWRDASGLSKGGTVEVRAVRDRHHSILLTPLPSKGRGISGKELIKQLARCPWPMRPPARHRLSFR